MLVRNYLKYKKVETEEGDKKEADNMDTEIKFSELGLAPEILEAVTSAGYHTPSPIQAETIPHILNGTDVLGMAQTGTGKTAAVALPTLSLIDTSKKYTQVLVLAPTRELAIQVAESFKVYSRNKKGINVASIYGGQDYKIQINALRKGAHVVVGTPGRVMDHIRRETLKIDNIVTLVLDEADEMLRMGFIDDVEWILSHTPEQRQITLFSATMPYSIKKMTKKYLNNPVEVKIKTKTETAANINQRYLTVKAGQKMTALARVLEAENSDATIIFAKTKTSTVDIADFLNAQGLKAIAINGDLQQKQRERAIDQIKAAKLDILVATDVAARGLDVSRISHVINYDIPQDNETYVHRIGRTGRAGRSGDAILFITPKERRHLASIERMTNKTIAEFKMPTIDDINKKRIEYFKGRITRVMEGKDNSQLHEIIKTYCTETEADPIEVAAALAKIAHGRKPLLLTERDELQTSFSKTESRDRDRTGRRDSRSKKGLPNSDMQLYKIELGRNDDIRPANVVGAFANEAGLDGDLIGQIEIYDDYTTVGLPKKMSKSTLDAIKKVRIAGNISNLSLVGEYTGSGKSNKQRGRKSFSGGSSRKSFGGGNNGGGRGRGRSSGDRKSNSSDKPRRSRKSH